MTDMHCPRHRLAGPPTSAEPTWQVWLLIAIAWCRELWRSDGRHRVSRRELSTFEEQSDAWGRTSVLDWPYPVIEPVVEPTATVTTIGQRARLRGVTDTHEFRTEFDSLVATEVWPDGTNGYAIGDRSRLEQRRAA